MLERLYIRKLQIGLIVFVLLAHGIWIVNHMRWVAEGRIDPWKLGGYGMYTIPPPSHSFEVIDLSSPDRPIRLRPGRYNINSFLGSVMASDPNRVFRCQHVKAKDLEVFFEDNIDLRGVDLAIVFRETEFVHSPVSLKWVEEGRVQVQWVNTGLLVYASQFCGEVETGEVAFS